MAPFVKTRVSVKSYLFGFKPIASGFGFKRVSHDAFNYNEVSKRCFGLLAVLKDNYTCLYCSWSNKKVSFYPRENISVHSLRIFHVKKKNRAKGNLWTKPHFIVKSISSNLCFLTLNEFTWQNWQKFTVLLLSFTRKSVYPPQNTPTLLQLQCSKIHRALDPCWQGWGAWDDPCRFLTAGWQRALGCLPSTILPQGKCSWYYLQHSHMSQQMPGTIRPRQQNSINRWGNSWH